LAHGRRQSAASTKFAGSADPRSGTGPSRTLAKKRQNESLTPGGYVCSEIGTYWIRKENIPQAVFGHASFDSIGGEIDSVNFMKSAVGRLEMQISSKARTQLILCATALLMTTPAVVFYVLLWKTAFQLPLVDDYDVILKFVNVVSQSRGVSVKLLYAVTVEHNGYKLMLDNFVTLTQYTLCGKVYFFPLVALGDSFALFIFLVTCSMSQVVPRDVVKKVLLLVPVAFLVLQLQYASALNFASCSLQQLPVIFFSFLSILLLTRPTLLSVAGACLALVLAIASSPNGFFIAPLGLILLVQMRRWRHMPGWVIIAGMMAAVYAFRYHRIASQRLPSGSIESASHLNVIYALSFLGSSAARYFSVTPSLTLGVLLLALVCVAAGRRYFAKNPAIFYCMVFIVINSVAVSGLRSDLGLAQSLASRYRIYSNLLLAFSYMYIIEDLLPFVKTVTVRRIFLAGAVTVSVAFCALSDIAGARFLEAKKETVSAVFAEQWHSQSTGAPAPKELANPALARELAAGLFDVDLGVLQESVRLGVYTPPIQP